MESEVAQLLGEIRRYTEQFKAGDNRSALAFRNLAAQLLGQTVAAAGASPRLVSGDAHKLWVLGGPGGPTTPLKLRNGAYLKLAMTLVLVDQSVDGNSVTRLKVRDSSFQYQLDEQGDQWVFRYDYERDAADRHPRAHLHVRGSLTEAEATATSRYHGTPERIHYPTNRISLEAVIRLLIDQFGVAPATSPEVWRKILAESERLFNEIAHQPLSGPDGLTPSELAAAKTKGAKTRPR